MISINTDQIQFQLDPAVDNYAVMGNPVVHSRSPEIHLAFARQSGQKIDYQSIYVPSGKYELAARLFQEHGGKGLNITVPYKHDAYRLVDTLTSRAKNAEAVNTVTFLENRTMEGDNTDGIGLVRDLEQNGIQISASRILIIGAGGAVSGVLGPLLGLGPDSIFIANRTVEKAEHLVTRHNLSSNIKACKLSDLQGLGQFDVIINGTSSVLSGELPALPESIITRNSSCYDMVYGNKDTVFVQWCKTHGAKVAIDGLGMLVEQAAESFYLWRGIRPDTVPVIEMLRAGD